MQPPQQRPPVPRVHVESVTQCGWTVTARKAPIIGSPLLEEYSDKLGGVLTLPEILFGNSSLQLRHDATGITLNFTAFEALHQWKQDNLPPLKVAVAKEWQAARQQEIEAQQAVVLNYDWTYTTSYAGSVTVDAAASSGPAQDSQNPADQPSRAAAPAGNKHGAGAAAAATGAAGDDRVSISSGVGNRPHDQNQAHNGPNSSSLVQQQQPQQQSQQARAPPAWQQTNHQIDRHMLMSKSEPILFYAEVPLYESELDDNGVCQLTAKVRVMPRCWLVLLRLWLRVDGCLVRLWEVRHFCRLDTPAAVIIRETKHCEGTLQQLAAAGAPTAVSGYEDAEAAAAVFSAIAPQCLRKFELHELQLPPGSGASSSGSDSHGAGAAAKAAVDGAGAAGGSGGDSSIPTRLGVGSS